MKDYYLHEDAYLCTLEGGAVILDLNANRYIGIDSHDMPELQRRINGLDLPANARLPNGSTDTTAATTLESLLEFGLLTASSDRGKPVLALLHSAIDTLDSAVGVPTTCTVTAEHVFAFTRSFIRASIHFRTSHLAPLIHRFRRLNAQTRAGVSCSDPKTVAALIAFFRRMRPWTYTARDHCLLDSLALADFLHTYQQFPTFVIGIQTKPFRAHAWVQVGELLVDECLENVQSLQPILMV